MAPVLTLPFRGLSVHASATNYTFRCPSFPDAASLVIDRPNGNMRMVENAVLQTKSAMSIVGILGVIRLRLDKYIIVITKAMVVGRIRGHSVYKIQATEFLPLQEPALHDHDEDIYLSLLRTHLRTGPMYFSYSFDLTNSLQRQSSADTSLPLWQRADDRFFWNRYIQSDLIDLRSSQPTVDPFILPVFFGFLTIATTRIKNTPMTFILITRKSRHRAGTRYFTRGVDESGNVANFNETEQILVIGDAGGGLAGYDPESVPSGSGLKEQVNVVSYVQTRGSVPAYWAEVNNLHYVPKLQIRGVEGAVPAAQKHFDEQIRLYGDNYCVNLVNQKGREEQVKAAYEKVVKSLVSSPSEAKQASEKTPERFRVIEPTEKRRQEDRIHYVYFDFHHECRGMKWHRAQLLLDQLGDGLYNQRYFYAAEGGPNVSSVVRNTQASVVRTNCMDCLDRTNVVQSMLARWTLNRQLLDLGVLDKGENAASFVNFETLFRNAWADNADVVSRAYSGTGALKTDFTRTGVRTKNGAFADLMNSITRYIRNNFADGPRQDAYDLFLGNYLPYTSGISSSMIFVDRRPLFIQAVPYILFASVFLALFALIKADSRVIVQIFLVFWLAVGAYSARFIYTHGMLYVNWPKLNRISWAVEGYNEALGRVKKDRIAGPLVARHERGASSNIRLVHLEEGKKLE
ncbi:SacI homology domain-containing protein [Peziza echinospora]|nr:SacI homology domain-containing protein [Peziza echinospora]